MKHHFGKPFVIVLLILCIFLIIGISTYLIVRLTVKPSLSGKFSSYAKEFGTVTSYTEYSGNLGRAIPSTFSAANKSKKPCQAIGSSANHIDYATAKYSKLDFGTPDADAPAGWELEPPDSLVSLVSHKKVGDKYICASVELLGVGIPEEPNTGPTASITFYSTQ